MCRTAAISPEARAGVPIPAMTQTIAMTVAHLKRQVDNKYHVELSKGHPPCARRSPVYRPANSFPDTLVPGVALEAALETRPYTHREVTPNNIVQRRVGCDNRDGITLPVGSDGRIFIE